MTQTTFLDVFYCPRCQGEHRSLMFSRFNIDVIVESVILEYWGICPNTKEPILFDSNYDLEDYVSKNTIEAKNE